MYATIQKWGNSHAVRLPKAILDELMMRENDTIEITSKDDNILIKKASRKRIAKKTLEERFAGYAGGYECVEYDWGKPVGKEAW